MPAGWLPRLTLVLRVTLGLPIPLGLGVVARIFPHRCQVEGFLLSFLTHAILLLVQSLKFSPDRRQPLSSLSCLTVVRPVALRSGTYASHERRFIKKEARPNPRVLSTQLKWGTFWLLSWCLDIIVIMCPNVLWDSLSASYLSQQSLTHLS